MFTDVQKLYPARVEWPAGQASLKFCRKDICRATWGSTSCGVGWLPCLWPTPGQLAHC